MFLDIINSVFERNDWNVTAMQRCCMVFQWWLFEPAAMFLNSSVGTWFRRRSVDITADIADHKDALQRIKERRRSVASLPPPSPSLIHSNSLLEKAPSWDESLNHVHKYESKKSKKHLTKQARVISRSSSSAEGRHRSPSPLPARDDSPPGYHRSNSASSSPRTSLASALEGANIAMLPQIFIHGDSPHRLQHSLSNSSTGSNHSSKKPSKKLARSKSNAAHSLPPPYGRLQSPVRRFSDSQTPRSLVDMLPDKLRDLHDEWRQAKVERSRSKARKAKERRMSIQEVSSLSSSRSNSRSPRRPSPCRCLDESQGNIYVCLFACFCLSVSLLVCPLVCPSVCMLVSLSVCRSDWLSILSKPIMPSGNICL